jgi:hypothetical protein
MKRRSLVKLSMTGLAIMGLYAVAYLALPPRLIDASRLPELGPKLSVVKLSSPDGSTAIVVFDQLDAGNRLGFFQSFLSTRTDLDSFKRDVIPAAKRERQAARDVAYAHLESQMRQIALALPTVALLLFFVGYFAWRRYHPVAQSNQAPAADELMGPVWSQRPAAQLVRWTAKLLPASQRALYVETTCGNLDTTESRLERTVYLVGELIQMPKTAWVYRSELRRRGPTR